MHKLLIIILLLSMAAAAQMPVAELPRVYIDTTWNQPIGVQWQAHTSTDFRNALNSAQPGDTIILDAGTIYNGNFTLPAKNNPNHKWIYIQTSSLSTLPQPGTRVTPLDSAKMPKLVTTNAGNALTIAPGGGYVRFVGVEMYSTSTYLADPNHTPWPINGFIYYLLYGSTASNVTVDRCYIHGSDTEDVNHAIGFTQNSSYVAVVDSDIRDIHGETNDSQAFIAFSSPGPFKLVNNYLSATTEDVMFGGAGGYTNPYVPSDIEVRNNHFYKPTSWLPRTLAPGQQWIVKNNLECKACLRMVVTGNLMENSWYSGDQVGSNIVLTPRTAQSGINSVDDDITIQNNTLQNANFGFTIGGYDNTCVAPSCLVVGETKRVVIKNNLILTRDPAGQGSYHPLGFSMGMRMDGLLIQHNTVQGINGTQSWGSFYFGASNCPSNGDQPTNVWILDNALSRQPTGDCGYQGQRALDSYIPLPAPDSSRFAGNVMFVPPGDRLNSWPLHDYATTVPFTFVNVSTGNYQLVTPNWTDTSDGQIAGVNMSLLSMQNKQTIHTNAQAPAKIGSATK